MKLTHFDEGGNAHMVDVSAKDHTERVAVAEGFITLSEEAFHIVTSGNVKKGDVLAVAQLAAIMGAKQTSLMPSFGIDEGQCRLLVSRRKTSCVHS